MLLTNSNVNRLRLMSPSTVSLDNRVGFIELFLSYGQSRTPVQIHWYPALKRPNLKLLHRCLCVVERAGSSTLQCKRTTRDSPLPCSLALLAFSLSGAHR